MNSRKAESARRRGVRAAEAQTGGTLAEYAILLLVVALAVAAALLWSRMRAHVSETMERTREALTAVGR